MTAYKLLFIFLSTLVINDCLAQGKFVAYSQAISTKGYEGHRFKLSAFIKTENGDDSARATLFARVDKPSSQGFSFNTLKGYQLAPNEWKEHIIKGVIDTGSYQIVFGTTCYFNGQFYVDNLSLEIEIVRDKWINIFNCDFENKKNPLIQGNQKKTAGLNTLFLDKIFSGQGVQYGNSCLQIIGDNVPNYGDNKKVGKFASVNGIKLYYEIYGEGPPLVRLHGNGGSIQSSEMFIPELMKNYKVIAIDSRGQGKSTDDDKPLTYEQMASDINILLEQLNIDSTYIWGQSDGGVLGLILAMDYPKKVKKLLAFGANIQSDSLAVFPWTITLFTKKIEEAKSKKEQKLYQLMLDHPNIAYSKLSTIKAPVLIMVGDRDGIRPEHTLKIFQNIPNSQLSIIPGATHNASKEKKEMVLEILNDFFLKPFSMPKTEL